MNTRLYLKISLLFALVSVVVTYPLILNMNGSIYGPFFGTDMRGGLWNLWWGKYALSHHLNYNSCPFLAAPFGLDLTGQPVSWVVISVLGAILFFSSPLFCFNILMFISFVLTGLAAFLLIFDLIKNRAIAILTALFFTFSPYHLNKVMEFGFFFLGNWLILYVWAIVKVREVNTFKYAIYAAIALGLTIALNPYYGFFAIIMTFGFFIFSLMFNWKDTIGARTRLRDCFSFLKSGAFIFLGAAFINAPLLILVIRNFNPHITQLTQISASGYIRSFDYLFAQSARPLSYLLPASTHPVFGDFTKQMFGSIFYGRGPIEQTLYLGWVPMILAFFAFRRWRYKRLHQEQYLGYMSSQENFYIGFFIFSACVAFIFSMPPFVDLGIFKLFFPSFFVYKIAPMFRAYARFGIIVMLCVCVLAGYGLTYLFERLKTNNKRIACAVFVAIAVMFEFMNVPPSRVADMGYIPPVYLWLSQQPGDFIVAEYPMSQGSPGEANENCDYFYYQTYHQKRLVNGAVPGTKAFEIKQKILKVDDPQTVNVLRGLGVKCVIFHSEPYRKGDYKEAVDIVGEVPKLDKNLGWKLIGTFDTEYVYEIAV